MSDYDFEYDVDSDSDSVYDYVRTKDDHAEGLIPYAGGTPTYEERCKQRAERVRLGLKDA